jgi:hypothetical protein
MRKTLVILPILVLAFVVWVYLFTGTPPWGSKFTPPKNSISAMGLSWLGTNRMIQASSQCADVLQTMCQARESQAVATPPLGSLTIYYPDGTTNLFHLSPSERLFGLQISGERGGCYVISTHKMLDVFGRVGLLPKDH